MKNVQLSYKILLFPFSVLYGIIISIRHFLYDYKLIKSHKFATPTICIGNIGLGGTGKTPMTEYLIRLLKKKYTVAVLSRGYKRKTKGLVFATSNSTCEDLGDEPFQFHYKNPEVQIAVCENRVLGIHSILSKNKNTDIILLDDAFQHRKITPAFSLVLTPYYNLYSDDFLLPLGKLRDTKSRAKNADTIFVTKCPKNLSENKKTEIIEKIKPAKNQKVYFTGIKYSENIKSVNSEENLDIFLKKPFYLVVGIANPTPLINFLKRKNANFQILNFPNHHFFSEKELTYLKNKQPILTTEKDFVRLYQHIPNIFYLPIETYFIDNKQEKEFITQIENKITQKKSE